MNADLRIRRPFKNERNVERLRQKEQPNKHLVACAGRPFDNVSARNFIKKTISLIIGLKKGSVA